MEPEGYRPSAQARIEKICADAVRSAVNAQLGENDRTKRIGRSLYSYLLQEMAKAASDLASGCRTIRTVSGGGSKTIASGQTN
jgi:hypothetical protein